MNGHGYDFASTGDVMQTSYRYVEAKCICFGKHSFLWRCPCFLMNPYATEVVTTAAGEIPAACKRCNCASPKTPKKVRGWHLDKTHDPGEAISKLPVIKEGKTLSKVGEKLCHSFPTG